MSLEAIETVVRTEEKSKVRTQDARAAVKQQLSEAEEAGRALVQETRAKAEAARKERMEKAEAEAAALSEEILRAAKAEAEGLRGAAEANLDAAAELIVGKVVNG